MSDSSIMDERRARLAWARVAEPADSQVHQWTEVLGHVKAWEDLVAGRLDAPDGMLARARTVDVDREERVLVDRGWRVVTPADDEWPEGLADLDRITGAAHGQPHCLWVRGPLDLGEGLRRAVAMVGSRAATSYGESQARELGAGAADAGWTVVSGAAFGIDGAAHEGALAVDGSTIAVLACGVDQSYPRSHHALLEAIASTGAVVAEVPPGFAPLRHRFLARNRLIAALARGTCVVEAGLRSGALNTARTAQRLSRPVAALPGPVTHMSSAGCHDLIRQGAATLVTDAAELLEAVAPVGQGLLEEVRLPEHPLDALTAEERRLHDCLRLRREITVDELGRLTAFDTATVLSLLGRLEAIGWVQRGPAGGWRKARRGAPSGAR